MRVLAVGLAVLVGGCGARTPLDQTLLPDGGAGDAIAGDASRSYTLHGSFIVHYFPDAGEVDVPKDLSASTVEVYVMGATLRGSGKADGTFAIDNVPSAGPYTLRVDDLIIVGVEDGVILTTNLPGRPDADRSSGPGSLLALTLDGLAPMPPGPYPPAGPAIMLGSSNAGCAMVDFESQWQPVPQPGSTSVSATTARVSPLGREGCRIDPSRGDRSFFVEFGSIHELDLPSFTTAASEPISVTGTLTVPPSQTLAADFRPSSFMPALFVPGAVKPSAQILLEERPPVSLYAGPWLPTDGVPTPTSDGPFMLQYHDAFPTWTKVLVAVAVTTLDLPLPGSSQTYSSYLRTQRFLDYMPSMGPIAIALSPPRNVVVGAAAPFAPTTGAGTTPTIHWSKPDYEPVGLLRYSVDIVDISPVPGMPIPTIWTTQTSVVVPAGFLQPGHVYAPTVSVQWSEQKVDFAAHPLDGDFTEVATAPSGTFTP